MNQLSLLLEDWEMPSVPPCEHCGEEIWLDVIGSEVDYRPCCEAKAAEVEEYGFDGVYGFTLKSALRLELGYGDELREVFGRGVRNELPVPLEGNAVLLDCDEDEHWEDTTRVRFPLEEKIPGPGIPGWQREVFDYVQKHHSHHGAPQGWKFGVAVENGLERVGVAIVGRPVSRMLQKAEPLTWEVTRVCVAGHRKLRRNACTKLYAMCAKEAKKLGCTKLITYTLESEDATSLKAAGWRPVALSSGGSWSRKGEGRQRKDKAPLDRKIRWEKVLDPKRATALPAIELSKRITT